VTKCGRMTQRGQPAGRLLKWQANSKTPVKCPVLPVFRPLGTLGPRNALVICKCGLRRADSGTIKSADAPVVVELKRAPIMAIRPTGEEVQLAVAVTPPPVMSAETAETTKTLPVTGSSLPMIAVFGMLALFGGFALRTAARRLQ